MFQPLGVVEVAALLDEIVAEYPPGHCYEKVPYPPGFAPGCVYTYEGKPSCLIGILLGRLGYIVNESSHWNVIPIDGLCASAPDVAALFDGPEAVQFLRAVQARQDVGYPWDFAVSGAKKIFPDLFPVRSDDAEPNTTV